MRAFLALPVEPPALAEYQALRDRLMTELPAVRWSPADSPHVTLHFFGSIDDHQAVLAVDVVRPICLANPQLTLRLDGLGGLPSNRRPSVVWCGVGGDVGPLSLLAVTCATALRDAGFAVDSRPYLPHCTLGRPRRPWPPQAHARWHELTASACATAQFSADRLLLYESVSTAAGVRHVPREAVPLGGPAVHK